jgi:hypothetical protein
MSFSGAWPYLQSARQAPIQGWYPAKNPVFYNLSGGNGTVNRKIIISVAALGLAGMAAANVAQAFNFGNMMNPSRWFDNDRDRYYDRGYYGGYGGPYGYGGGPYGYGGGPYGWGGGPYGGWGGYGPYGYGGGYGGGYPSTIVVSPSSGDSKAPPPKMPE